VSIDVFARASAGPFAAACLVLAWAGASKLRRPRATRPAAAALGLPDSPTAVRALGIVELTAAVAGLTFGGYAAATVAVIYAALAVAAWRLLAQSPGTACGCFGSSDAPVSVTHVVVNAAALIAAALAAGRAAPFAAVGHNSWAMVAFVALVGCCGWLVASVLDSLPALNATVHEGGAR
jgi:hypothetical protein